MEQKTELFNRQAASYAEFRPSYPEELYKVVLKYCDFSQKPNQALDIATGSGQAAFDLSTYFERIIAIDSSVQQLKQARARDNITYQKGLAEDTGVESRSTDLITVAQALHWFEFPKFYAECARVLRPGGKLAVWGYGLPKCQGNEQVTELIAEFANSKDRMGPYWAPERRHIDEEYDGIFPGSQFFDQTKKQNLVSTSHWDIDTLIGYLSSWSPYSTYRHRHPDRDDPLIAFKAELLKHCNARDGNHKLSIDFPIFLLMGTKKQGQ